MAFRPPTYNLLANLWTCDANATPTDGDPTYEDIPVQKYLASRAAWPVSPPWANGFYLDHHPPVQLRFPRVPPFDTEWHSWPVTIAEVPAGSGQYYRNFFNDVQHEGFVNEYALVVAVQCNSDGKAIPPAGSTIAAGISTDPCGNLPPQDEVRANIPGSIWCCNGDTPPADEFEDQFEDTSSISIESHTANSGESWTEPTNSIQIDTSGTGVVQTVGSSGYVYAVADYDGAQQTQTVCGMIALGSLFAAWPAVGLCVRCIAPGECFMLLWEDAGGGDTQIRFYQVSSGVPSGVGSPSSPYTPDLSKAHQLSVQRIGNAFTGILTDEDETVCATTSHTTTFNDTQVQLGLMLEANSSGETQNVYYLTSTSA